MTQRHFAPSTPPFAFPAIIAEPARRPTSPPGGRLAPQAPGIPPLSLDGRGRVDSPLACPSAVVVCGLFLDAMARDGRAAATMTVLDLGAGDGRAGRLLARHGISTLIAVDAEPIGDQPSVYADRIVGDLTALPPRQRARLERHRFDGLVSVGGLGPRGVTPSEFLEALDCVAIDGLVCVALDADVLGPRDFSGFGVLIRALGVRGVLELEQVSDFGRRVRGHRREQVALLAHKRRPVWDA